jgi:hypothetical protein
MKNKYAIIAHSPAVIMACEREKRFSMLDDYSYLLVGRHNVFLENTWTLCNLPDNIEHHRKLLHYTAMYAVVNNGLFADYDRVTFLEHDTKILSTELGDRLAECEHTAYFEEEPVGNMFAGKYAAEAKAYIQENYGDIYMMYKSHTRVLRCLNISLPMPILKQFIRCPHTQAFMRHIEDSDMAGHSLERWMSYWLWTNDPNAKCLPYLLKNLHHKSHGQL